MRKQWTIFSQDIRFRFLGVCEANYTVNRQDTKMIRKMIQIDETKVTNENDAEFGFSRAAKWVKMIRNASHDCEFSIIFVRHFCLIDLDHFSYNFSVLAIYSVVELLYSAQKRQILRQPTPSLWLVTIKHVDDPEVDALLFIALHILKLGQNWLSEAHRPIS